MGSRLWTKTDPKSRSLIFDNPTAIEYIAWVAPYEGFPRGRTSIHFVGGQELLLAESPDEVLRQLRMTGAPGIAMQLPLESPPWCVET